MQNVNKSTDVTPDSSTNHLHINPHPPREPCKSKNESFNRVRQRRYRHQSSEARNDTVSINVREIRSAGCTAENSLRDFNKPYLTKTKISSAPSPRNRITRQERNNGLYTFDSIPSLITEKKETQNLPRTKKKDIHSSSSITIDSSPNLRPINTLLSLLPAKSEASPVVAIESIHSRRLFKIDRQSLSLMSGEKFIQKSLPVFLKLKEELSSDNCAIHSAAVTPDICESRHLNNSTTSVNNNNSSVNNTLNLEQYQSPDNLSDSFEGKMLESLTKQFTTGDEAHIKALLPDLLSKMFPKNDDNDCHNTEREDNHLRHPSRQHNSHRTPQDNTEKSHQCQSHNHNNFQRNQLDQRHIQYRTNKIITPRTEALIRGSYSDEESLLTSVTTANTGEETGGGCNNTEFHHEWKNNVNSSQDTYCSTDGMSTINESLATDEGGGDLSSRKSSNLSTAQSPQTSPHLISVVYMAQLQCYFEPSTGKFYESAVNNL